MSEASLTIVRWLFVGAPGNSLALSEDGHYLLVGSEHDLRILDRWGNNPFRYYAPPAPGRKTEEDLPFCAAAVTPDMRRALAGLRSGEVFRLELTWDGDAVSGWPEQIRAETNDIYSMSLAPDASLMAIGHLGPALTVLDWDGQTVWRRHPADHTPTDGKTWAVALSSDAATLYVGSSGTERCLLAALDASSGKPQAGKRLWQRVTQLAALPAPLAVVAVLGSNGESQVAAFAPDLTEPAWTYSLDLGEQVTALTTDQAANLVVCGTNSGAVMVLDGRHGELLARTDALRSTVLSLAMTAGRYLVAGIHENRVAYLEYIPPTSDEELAL